MIHHPLYINITGDDNHTETSHGLSLVSGTSLKLDNTISPTSSISEPSVDVSLEMDRMKLPIGSVSEPLFDVSLEIDRAISPISSVSELLFDGRLEIDRTISPIGSVSEPSFNATLDMDLTISPIGSVSEPLFDASLEVDRTMSTIGSFHSVPKPIVDVADLTTIVSLRSHSKALIKPIKTKKVSAGKLEEQHQSTALISSINKEALIDGMVVIYQAGTYAWVYPQICACMSTAATTTVTGVYYADINLYNV